MQSGGGEQEEPWDSATVQAVLSVSLGVLPGGANAHACVVGLALLPQGTSQQSALVVEAPDNGPKEKAA